MDINEIGDDFKNLPIITLGDDLQGILGLNSTDSSIFTDILLRNKDKKDELDDEIKDIINEATETFSTTRNTFSQTLSTSTDFVSSDVKADGNVPESVVFQKMILSEMKDTPTTDELIVPEKTNDLAENQAVNLDLIAAGKPSNLAVEYESFARSILVPSPAPPANEKKKFACSICCKDFPDRRYLNRHFSKHTNRFTCPHCQKSFSRKESLMKHIPSNCKIVNPVPKKRKEKDAQAKPRFSCEKCFQQFTRKENYHQHMFKHEGLRILCNECQKTSSSWKSFLSHRKMHDNTRTVYFCNHCAAVFSFKSNLERHLRRAQKGDSTLVCKACNLRVKTQDSLDKHKSQPIKRCVVCSQTFCLDNDLRKHRKVLHPEIWFKCKLCDSGIVFTARSEHHLLDHVKKAHNLSLTFTECYEDEWYVKCD